MFSLEPLNLFKPLFFIRTLEIMMPFPQGHYENLIIDPGTLAPSRYTINIGFLSLLSSLTALDISDRLAHHLLPSATGPVPHHFLMGLPYCPPSATPSWPFADSPASPEHLLCAHHREEHAERVLASGLQVPSLCGAPSSPVKESSHFRVPLGATGK